MALALKPLPGYVALSCESCCMYSDDDMPGTIRAKMPCQCVIAPAEVARMCKSNLSGGSFEFKCPNCDGAWPFFVVRHVLKAVLSKDEILGILEQLGKNSIKNQRTQTCTTCNSVFTRDFSKKWYENKERVLCAVCTSKNGYNTDICWRCGNRWKSVGSGGCGNATCHNAVLCDLETLRTCKEKRIGEVFCPNTRACPRCGQLIEHIEKCKHMDCKVCKCSFCFVCLKEKQGGQWQCGGAYSVCAVAARQTSIPNN